MKASVAFTIFVTTLGSLHAYKHIILMHGVLASPREFDDFIQLVNKSHPGTTFTVIDAFNRQSSLDALWEQVKTIGPKMMDVMKKHKEGVHLLCFSQGGILCRGILEYYPHNVDTFIALSTPQGGQFGDTDYFKFFFPTFGKEHLYRFFYTREGQRWSVGNYWNDPHHQDLYLQYSNYLAVINNQSYNNQSQEFKKNFLRLKNLITIGGPDDGVITPWQSSHFAFYNSNETVLEMEKQEWYLKDSFGLKTLNERGAFHTYSIPGVKHIKWHGNETVFNCCIKKWLT